MRIGIVADVHDALPRLREALGRFESLRVDRVLTLGDLAETFGPGDPGAEAARWLARAGAEGVWGNHDFGLSREIPDEVRRQADPVALAFTAGLEPHVVIGDCRFSHVEPWRDPFDVMALWSFDGVPETPEAAARCFEAVRERLLFVGHFHRWFAVTPSSALDWEGDRPLDLGPPDRLLVGLGATRDGWCALLDLGRMVLEPIRLA